MEDLSVLGGKKSPKLGSWFCSTQMMGAMEWNSCSDLNISWHIQREGWGGIQDSSRCRIGEARGELQY